MTVTKQDIFNAVVTNDTEMMSRIFKEFNLSKDIRPNLTLGKKECICTILSNASAMSYLGKLERDMKKEIISYTAMAVDIFSFLRLTVLAANIHNRDLNTIPRAIRSALEKDEFTEDIAHEIELMDDEVFEALLDFIINKIDVLDVLYSTPIIRHIYERGYISVDLLFMYMIFTLRDTIEERIFDFIVTNDINLDDDENEDN